MKVTALIALWKKGSGIIFQEANNATLMIEEMSSRSRRLYQGFCNEEISKSEIFDMVCVVRSFENDIKGNIKE
jgi:hypothetical protein